MHIKLLLLLGQYWSVCPELTSEVAFDCWLTFLHFIWCDDWFCCFGVVVSSARKADACVFCGRADDNAEMFGEKRRHDGVVVHYFCVVSIDLSWHCFSYIYAILPCILFLVCYCSIRILMLNPGQGYWRPRTMSYQKLHHNSPYTVVYTVYFENMDHWLTVTAQASIWERDFSLDACNGRTKTRPYLYVNHSVSADLAFKYSLSFA